MNSLKQKAFSGIIWTFIEQVFLMLSRILINIFIARQLFPEDYGLIAVIAVFINISEVFVNGGMKKALIRKPEIKPEDPGTIFFFNLSVAFCLYVVLYKSAPFIAAFYEMPKFTNVSRVLGVVIIIHALSMVQDALINRELRLKFYAKVNISATFIGGTAGLIAAYNGFGVWSLVVQSLTRASSLSIIFWSNTTWFPSIFKFSLESLKENFNFGYKLVLSGLVNAVFNNLYQLVIGKVYNAASLGNYTQGKRLGELPSGIFYIIFQRTGFAVLSTVQKQNNRFNQVYLKLLRILGFISFPLAFLMILVGEYFIILMLTEKWENAIPFFYVFCFSGMFYPITGISAHACLAKGRSDLFLKLEILYKIMMAIMIYLTFRYDIMIMVMGQASLLILQFIINFIVVGKLIELKFISQLKALYPSFLMALGSFVIVNIMSSYVFIDLFNIPLEILLFSTTYLLGAYYFKIGDHKLILDLIKKKIKK